LTSTEVQSDCLPCFSQGGFICRRLKLRQTHLFRFKSRQAHLP